MKIMELFHRLWTKAVGTPDYVKSEWRELDGLIYCTEQKASQGEIDRHQLLQYQAKTKGEYWAWQGDGEDHLESLTCPVLIPIKDFAAIVAERDGLRAELEDMRTLLERINNSVGNKSVDERRHILTASLRDDIDAALRQETPT